MRGKKCVFSFGGSWLCVGGAAGWRGFQKIEGRRIGVEHQRGVLVNDLLERLQFAQKTIKIRLLLMRRGINARHFRFRFAARFFGRFARFSEKNGFLRVRLGIDRVRFLSAFRAVALGELRALRAHPLENETRVHFRQRDPLDADLFDVDTERVLRLTRT